MKGVAMAVLWTAALTVLGWHVAAGAGWVRPAAPLDRLLSAAADRLGRGIVLYTVLAAAGTLLSGLLQRRRGRALGRRGLVVRFQPGRESAEKPAAFAEFLEALYPALLVDHPFLGLSHHLSVTMVSTEKGVEFCLWLPELDRRDFPAEVQAALTAHYPGARVERCADPLAAVLAGGAGETLIRERWRTVGDVAYPLRGFDSFKKDPLNGRLRAARVPAGAGVRALGMRLLVRAIPARLEEDRLAGLRRRLGRRPVSGRGRRVGVDPVRKNRLTAVERKQGKERDLVLFETALETFALGHAQFAGRLLWNLDRTLHADVSYRQRGVYQGLRRVWRQAVPLQRGRGARAAESFLRREMPVRLPGLLPGVAGSRRSSLLTAPEMATALHLPSAEQNPAPRLERQRAALLPAPACAYVGEEERPGRTAWGVGEEEYGRGGWVGPGVRDRTQGAYMAAPTGGGKSTVLQNICLQDIAAGRSVMTLDMKGGLNEEIIRRLPREAEGSVVVFDPARCRRQVGLNPFDHRRRQTMGVNNLTSHLMGFLKRLAGANWSAATRVRSLMGSAIPLILELEKKPSLLHMYCFFLPESPYRQDLIADCDDPILALFWGGEFDEAAFSESILAVQTRLREFLRNAMIRGILCQEESTINVLEMMRQKQIFLGRLTTDEHGVGKEAQGLLGALLLGQFLGAALTRTGRAEAANYVGLVLDEFQSIVDTGKEEIQDLFSKARSGGLMLVAAHQSPEQLDDQTLNVILDNVPNVVLLPQTGPSARFFAGTLRAFDAEDLLNLGQYRAYARFKAEGQSTGFFSLATVPLPPAPEEVYAEAGGFAWPERDELDGLVNEMPRLPEKERWQLLLEMEMGRFQAYQARRRERDLAERAFVLERPGLDLTPLYPWAEGDGKVARVYHLSELLHGVPAEEVEAQVRRFLREYGVTATAEPRGRSRVIAFPSRTGRQRQKEAS